MRRRFLYLLLPLLAAPMLLISCSSGASAEGETPLTPEVEARLAKATFAGGCFWCMEPPYDELEGVISTTSGYAGGPEKDPTYRQVAMGRTGHTEVVQVVYDPERVSYEKLLEVFWHNIDPTVEDRQFCDSGTQYRTGIFYHDDEQKQLAEASKQALIDAKTVERVVTEVTALGETFYPAEDYHQDYYLKNPVRYKTYRVGCGRDRRLKALWGDAAGH